jgi:allophanate hydrolase
MPVQHYGSFVALIPAPLGIGTLALEDGSSVQGFVCEAQALQGAEDITHLGGWRAYLASLCIRVRPELLIHFHPPLFITRRSIS